MLFNSYEFLLAFLPITAIVFFGLARFRLIRLAIWWLTLTSLFFYGYWNPVYVPLLLISILGNFYCGQFLGEAKPQSNRAKLLLWLGIIFNLGILGYYKYAGFLVRSLSTLFQTEWAVPEIILPLGISFYSFTQIAYLVDAYRGETQHTRYDPLRYTLFVIFFPQLVAGPILRHDELIPELQTLKTFVFSHKNVAIGLATFTLGLAKKVLLADTLAPWANQVFNNASDVTFLEAWVGALSYTLQLYFDFSGYSDMAIGLGLIFNIHLPINFNSPYKATSITDFWRRWHITLSNFLRDYLYIPLGGNRKGHVRRYMNLMITMLLGGLWHGAGWTYVVWGGLHGAFLVINHAWNKTQFKLSKPLAWLLTFAAVVFSWVFFRATTLSDALTMVKTMLGLNGITLTEGFKQTFPWLEQLGVRFVDYVPYLPPNHRQSLIILVALLAGVITLPNTQQIMQGFKPSWQWAIGLGGVAAACLLSLNRITEFLYFQF